MPRIPASLSFFQFGIGDGGTQHAHAARVVDAQFLNRIGGDGVIGDIVARCDDHHARYADALLQQPVIGDGATRHYR